MLALSEAEVQTNIYNIYPTASNLSNNKENIMNNRSRNILRIIFIALFIAYLYFILPSGKEVGERLNNNFLKSQFEGVIINKFIDKNEHSYPIIIIKTFENDSIIKINLVRESTNIFDSLIISDSIYKYKNKSFLIRKRNGQQSFIGPVIYK